MKKIYFITGRRTYTFAKREMMKDDPRCFWCEIEVIDYGPRKEGEPDPLDMATVDHLVSRFFREIGVVVPKVLACAKCNQNRAKNEEIFFKKHYNLHCKYRKQKEYVQSI